MIIKGTLGTYKVFWRSAGWSYAEPVVQCKLNFIIFRKWSKVWVGTHTTCRQANKMHPEQLREWFESAVKEYEDYITAWSAEAEKES